MTKRNPLYNSECYFDPTAYGGMKEIIKEESIQQKQVNDLVWVLKYIIDKSGFEMINRVVLRDKTTGKEFR